MATAEAPMITRRLQWGGRMWRVATDDFALSSTCLIILHFIRLSFLTGVAVTAGNANCTDPSLVDVYVFGSMVVFVLAVVVDLALLASTCRGALPESGRRHRVSSVLTMRAVVFALEFASVFLGFSMVAHGIPSCSMDEEDITADLWLVWLMIVFGLQELIGCLLALWVSWDPNGARRVHGVVDTERNYYRTCSWLFCCVRNRDDNALQFIARSLSTFMERVENDPPSASDIVAGLALVRLKQTRLGKQLSAELGCAADLAVSKHCGHRRFGTTPGEVRLVADAAHFMQHAHAIYGWMLYVRTNIACGLCKLVGQCGCACCSGCHHNWGRTEHSTCARCNHTALNKHMIDYSAELAQKAGNDLVKSGCEIVYSCQWEGVFTSPFAVIIDRHKKAIVVAIRGTLSLADALQDAYAAPASLIETLGRENLSPELVNPLFMGHVGMLKGAKLIKERLDQVGVVDQLLRMPEHADFRLIITGHSLGAGLAACTALLFHKKYKGRMHCFPMSPPGGLFTSDLADAVTPFTTSVVLGIDVIPRLSVRTLHLLRDQVIRYFPQCKVNKWTLYSKFWNTSNYSEVFGSDELSVDGVLKAERTASVVVEEAKAAATPRKRPAVDSPFAGGVASTPVRAGVDIGVVVDEVVAEVGAGEEETKTATTVPGALPSTALLSRSTFTKDQLTLLPPGRIVHLVRSKVVRGCCCVKAEEFQAMAPRRQYFEQVIVGPRMMLDHMPDRVLRNLTNVAAALQAESPSAV